MTPGLEGRSTLSTGRVRTIGSVGSRDVLRDPVLIGLLVLLPAYFVAVWGWILPDESVTVEIPAGTGAVSTSVGFPELTTALVGPVTVALLVGIAGLFLVQRSRAADERLEVVGYRPAEILLARFGLLACIGAVVVTVTLLISFVHLHPEHVGWFLLALALAAATYGALGALLGLLVDRMAGVYIMLFAPMLDILLLGMPLGDSPSWAVWLPGHHATELALSAAFAETVATGHALWAGVVVLLLGVLAASVSGST